MDDYCHFIQKCSQVVELLDKSARAKQAQERQYNMTILCMLVDVAKTIGWQALAFRPHDAKNDDRNFYQIVNLLTHHNSLTKYWLDERDSRLYCVTELNT